MSYLYVGGWTDRNTRQQPLSSSTKLCARATRLPSSSMASSSPLCVIASRIPPSRLQGDEPLPKMGLRLPAHRYALKSAFYNAGASLPSPGSFLVHRIHMRVAAQGAYICRDCGYIYNDRKPFEKLPYDFSCPVCAAPKRRFKPYDIPVAKNSNQADARKARKEQLKRDSSLGNALPVGIVVGLAALVGTFLYLNSQF